MPIIISEDKLKDVIYRAYLMGKNDGWENIFMEWRDKQVERLSKNGL